MRKTTEPGGRARLIFRFHYRNGNGDAYGASIKNETCLWKKNVHNEGCIGRTLIRNGVFVTTKFIEAVNLNGSPKKNAHATATSKR